MSTRRTFLFSLVTLALVVPAGITSGAAVGAPADDRVVTPAATDLDSRIVGLMDDGYNDEDVLVSEGIAYMGGLDGMAVYDVADPSQPRFLSDVDGWVRGLAKEGNVLWIKAGSDDSGEIVALDVTDPAHTSVLAHIDPPPVPGQPADAYPQLDFEGPLLVQDGYLYAPSRHQQNPWTFYRALNVYDVHDPGSPVLVGQTALRRDTSSEDLLLRGSHLYVGDQLYLETVDVSTPAAPALVSSVDTASNALASDGPHLYSCYGSIAGEVRVYSLGDPAHPKYDGAISGPSDLLTCIDLEVTHPEPGMTAMVAAWQADSFTWVEVYDVTPPVKLGDASLLMDLGEIKDLGSGSVNDVELDASYVYVAQWDQGVRIAQVDYAKAAQQTPVLTKSPAADKVVLKRSGGAVSWKFFVTVTSPSGDPVDAKTMKIQRSLNGRTWKTLGSFPTNAQGLTGVKIKFTGPGTSYWRWLSPAEGSWLAAKTPRTKVVVR